jgi:hypothetical protein
MGRSAFPNRSWLGVLLLTATSPLLQAADEKEAARTQTAIAHGLEWLAKTQQKDGSWVLATEPNLVGGAVAVVTKEPNRPSFARRVAGTTLAVLPFLLAGYTHQEGAFKEVVSKGLKQITDAIKIDGHGPDTADWAGMYTHGLSTIALCKAYGRTKDPKLRGAGHAAVDFIVFSQDPRGGGWRYFPGDAGDTSVLGWQFTALKMAQDAGLKVPSSTFAGATKFLNSIQTDDGSAYYYLPYLKKRGDTPGPATTAIGLLCRTYLDWDRTTPALRKGVDKILASGPLDNIYFNYYATRLMHRYGGDEWRKWRGVMMERLIVTQDKTGPAAGSWFSTKDEWKYYLDRLGITALSLMTLEIGLE